MKRILNVLRLLTLTTAEEAYNETKEKLRLLLLLVYIAIGVPLLLLVIGTGFGLIGLTGVARGFNVAAGFLGAGLLAFVWIRAIVFAHIALFLAKGVKVATDGKQAFLDQLEVERFSKWLRGITAWASGVCLYAQLVPVWRHLAVSLVAATCILIFAAIMSAGWFGSKIPQYIFLGVTVVVFCVMTFSLLSPKFAQSFQAHKDRVLGAETLNETDQDLLTQKQTEREKIIKRAVQLCGGELCDGDKGKLEKLDQDIADLQANTYWEKRKAGVSPAKPAPKVEAPKAANGSPVADLPPPPPAPVTAPKAEPTEHTDDGSETPSSSGTKEKREQICAKYPELCSGQKGVAQKATPNTDPYQ